MWSSLIYGTWLGGRILGKPMMRAVAMVAATIGAWLYGQWPCDMGVNLQWNDEAHEDGTK